MARTINTMPHKVQAENRTDTATRTFIFPDGDETRYMEWFGGMWSGAKWIRKKYERKMRRKVRDSRRLLITHSDEIVLPEKHANSARWDLY